MQLKVSAFKQLLLWFASLRRYAREIGDLLRTIPRPLLLLLKTNDCLR